MGMSQKVLSNMIYPKRNDARWLLALYIFFFITYALISPGFTRTAYQFMAAFFTCILLDISLTYFYKKIVLFPLSGIISSSGIFLLCDSPFIWPYFLAAVLTISSKHFLTIDGRHIFNPNNFGMVLVSLLLPTYATISAGRWGGNIYIMLLLMVLGVLLTYRIDKIVLVLTFVLTFIGGAFFRWFLLHGKILTLLGPMTGAAFQLFIFYHISDPITTPQKKRHQVIFGIFLGIIDCFWRYKQNKFAPFLSLFILTGFYSYFKAEKKLDRILVWKY
jgi:Na+-transporting NADH:ubiquinone oxidoreductase subunit NqrB